MTIFVRIIYMRMLSNTILQKQSYRLTLFWEELSNFEMSTGPLLVIILLSKYKPYFPYCLGHPSAVQSGQFNYFIFFFLKRIFVKLFAWFLNPLNNEPEENGN